MKWVKVSGDDVNRVEYDQHSKTLKIKFEDGGTALATDITDARYAEYIAAAPREQTTYFRNMIAPYIVQKTSGGKLRAAAIVAAWSFGSIMAIWIVFSLINLLRLRGA